MRNSNRRVRDSLIRAIGSLGYHVADRTPPEQVRQLVRSLRPVVSERPLTRLGPDGDGGYLVPDDLDGIEHAFSPGVSNESGFEAALAARGMRVFLADFSVDGPAEAHPNFDFRKKHVGCLSDATFMTLEEWKAATIGAYAGDLLLQMDIEGGEYETLLSAPQALLSQFRIMVVEFHYLHELFNRRMFELASRAFARVLQTHTVVHIHPNNCCGSVVADGLEIPRIAELTFHRNDRVGAAKAYARTFPHPLDRDNVGKRTLPLPRCWYE
jgi:hypothetical protein